MALGKRIASQRQDSHPFSDQDEAIDAVSPKRQKTNARSSQRQQDEDEDEDDAYQEEEDDSEEEEVGEEEDQLNSDLDRIEEERRAADANLGSAQAGIIETIELRNFMCHANFSIDFGPRLNFVMGRNGSGKSTILTALMVALGGKTSSTNRGSSLKDLVKKGSSVATITVTIKNEGSDAFKYEVYGKRIIVERRILSEGTGTWKMKDASGRTIATTKAELEAFCDYANIQPDNPIHILTQDTARQFLGSSDPSEIYKFFLEGTQLSQLVREYNLIEGHVRSIKSALALKSTAILSLEKLAQQALQQWQKVQQTRKYQQKIDALDREVVWAQVHAVRRELEQAVLKTTRLSQKKEGYEKELEACQADLEKHNETIRSFEDDLADFTREFSPLVQQSEALEKKEEQLTAVIRQHQSESRDINDQIKRINADIERYEDQIREETEKLTGDHQAHRQELEQSRNELVQRKDELKEEEVEKQEEMREIEHKLDDVSKHEDNEDATLNRLRDEFENVEARLRNLTAASKNRIAAFGGAKVPELLRLIEAERGWIKKPLGPLGTHLKLKDMRWRSVLESVIGNTLNAFFVSNHADRTRLNKLMDRVGYHALILTGKETMFDYSAGEPDPNILTILRVLDIDDEIVKRQLIIAIHIERAALAETRSSGQELMRKEPQNVQHCFSLDMYSIEGGRLGSSSSALQEPRGAPRLSQNVSEDMRILREERERLQPLIAESNARIRELQREKSDLQKRLQVARRAHANARRQMDITRSDISRIDEEMQEAAPGNISVLEEAKRQSEEQKEKILEQFEAIQTKVTELRKQRDTVRQDLEKTVERTETFNSRKEEIEKQIKTAVELRVRASSDQQHWQKKIESCSAELASCEGEEERIESEHQNLEEQAKTYCDEVETDRNVEEIEREKHELQRLKKKAASEAGITLEQAAEELQNRQRVLKEAQEEIETMNEAERRLRHALTVRYAKWNFFRRSIATRAKSNFARNLSMRGYTGRLIFNHKTEKLSLHVQTEDKRQRQTQTGSSSKAMSGGERSFATTCLLLSLWQAMSSPIRCLDEFDIFMDQVNRKVAVGMIIQETEATPHVQYILITPQDMPSLAKTSSNVRMLMVSPPERSEGALAG